MVTRDLKAARAAMTERELVVRAARIRMVVTDVDGVLTDGGVFVSERGEELRRFSVRDGMGVELLRREGIETAFVTREASPIVQRRAEKLKLRHCHIGVQDKRAILPSLLADGGLQVGELGYIGDDVNDLDIMDAVAGAGLVAAPADAVEVVARGAHYRCAVGGGAGAFRDFADWILGLRARVGRVHAVDMHISEGGR